MAELEPYQEALRDFNEFAQRHLDEMHQADEMREFAWKLKGEVGVRAREDWQAKYGGIATEYQRRYNRYRELYLQHRNKPKPESEDPLPQWTKDINPESQDRWEFRRDRREKGKKVFGPGTTGDNQY